MKHGKINGFLTFGGGISKGGQRHSVEHARLIDCIGGDSYGC